MLLAAAGEGFATLIEKGHPAEWVVLSAAVPLGWPVMPLLLRSGWADESGALWDESGSQRRAARRSPRSTSAHAARLRRRSRRPRAPVTRARTEPMSAKPRSMSHGGRVAVTRR